VNTIPFMGETMKCVMCGRTEKSDPKVESNWRMIEADDVKFYVCPLEFPRDGASEEKFAKAYKKIVLKIARLRRGAD
jgi:hypothetical protein